MNTSNTKPPATPPPPGADARAKHIKVMRDGRLATKEELQCAVDGNPLPPLDQSRSSVTISHPFTTTLVITLDNSLHERLWLNREQAMELLEQLPGAIAQMPVNPTPNHDQ